MSAPRRLHNATSLTSAPTASLMLLRQNEAGGLGSTRRLARDSGPASRAAAYLCGAPRQVRDGVVGVTLEWVRWCVGAVEGRGAVRAGARAYLGPRPRRAAGR